MDAVGASFLEGDAGLAVAAGLHVRTRLGAVYHLCENPRGSRLADAPRPAEKICMRQLPPLYGIREGTGDVVLAEERFEGVRPVLPCRYDILTHNIQRYENTSGIPTFPPLFY